MAETTNFFEHLIVICIQLKKFRVSCKISVSEQV